MATFDSLKMAYTFYKMDVYGTGSTSTSQNSIFGVVSGFNMAAEIQGDDFYFVVNCSQTHEFDYLRYGIDE